MTALSLESAIVTPVTQDISASAERLKDRILDYLNLREAEFDTSFTYEGDQDRPNHCRMADFVLGKSTYALFEYRYADDGTPDFVALEIRNDEAEELYGDVLYGFAFDRENSGAVKGRPDVKYRGKNLALPDEDPLQLLTIAKCMDHFALIIGRRIEQEVANKAEVNTN